MDGTGFTSFFSGFYSFNAFGLSEGDGATDGKLNFGKRQMSILSSFRQKTTAAVGSNDSINKEIEERQQTQSLELFCESFANFPHHIAAMEAFLKTIPEEDLGHNWLVKENTKNDHEEKEIQGRAKGQGKDVSYDPKYKPVGYVPDWRKIAKQLEKEKDLGDFQYKRLMQEIEQLDEEGIQKLQKARYLFKQTDLLADEAQIYRPEPEARRPTYLHVDDQVTPLHYFDPHGQNIQQGKTVIILRAPGQMAEEYQNRLDGLRNFEKLLEARDAEEVEEDFEDSTPLLEKIETDPRVRDGTGPFLADYGGPDDIQEAEPKSTHTDYARRSKVLRSLQNPLDINKNLEIVRGMLEKIEKKIEASDQATAEPYHAWKDAVNQIVEMYAELQDKEAVRVGKEKLAKEVFEFEEMDRFKDSLTHSYDYADYRRPESIAEITQFYDGDFQHRRWGVIDWSRRTLTVNEYNLSNGRRFSNVIDIPVLWFNSFKEVPWPPTPDSIDYNPLNFATYKSMIYNRYVYSPRDLKEMKEKERMERLEKLEEEKMKAEERQ
ncbi:hypothetical protein PROFUN_10376 [Planoprotostelium fungivorum]|uniref:Uncharacterized protein n=1 Tax=Planoprotostelium fungivorum TaxID=1890364 RepID=A0A2P6NEB7_9EUKA|nr:hypothetical protein PROFUN_10376 [Planoprotostelium fungivorum]